MSKPKVLFTSHVANFQKFNRPFMRMLHDQGYEVHYASMGEEKILDCDKSFVVPFTRSPFRLSNVKAYFELKKIIDRENYDLIHTHTPVGSVVTRLAARDARKRGTRVIYTAHGFHFFKGAPIINWLIYYPVEKIMARYTDTLITINDEDYQRAKKHFKTDVRYVPGVGIDLSRFHPVDGRVKCRLREKYGLSKDSFVIIYAAELNANKNQGLAIRSLPKIKKYIPNVKLLLCGQGEKRLAYERTARRDNVEDDVKFMGYRQDLDKLFQLSDICVATSIREGLGLSLIEAIASGLPVVASNNRGHRDIVAENEKLGVLYPLNNQDALVSEIVNLKNSINTRQSFNLRALIDKYSIASSINNHRTIYWRQDE